jgi:hypothetical protein
MVMNRLLMIDSCSDWKPSDHLGIKIPRIGRPLLALYPRMNAEESSSRIPKNGCRLPVPVHRPVFDHPGRRVPEAGRFKRT